MGLGIGATAVVARRIGEKDDDGAAQAAAQSIALGLIVALAIGVFGCFNAERLMRLMGATPSMIESSLGYTQVMFAGNATVTLLFLNNAIFRGAGDPAIAMRMLWISNAINIAVCPLFIFGIGSVSRDGRDRRGGRHQHRPRLGGARPALDADVGPRRIHITRAHMRLVPSVMLERVPLERIGIPADPDRHVQLHRTGAGDLDVRQRRARRLHHWHPPGDLRDDAGVGPGQRRGDHGRAGARRGEARARRRGGMDRGEVQRDRAWPGRRRVHPVCAADRRDLLERSGGRAYAVGCLRIVSARLRVLCLRPGADAGLQRRRRYVDADLDQSGLLLGVADSAGVAAGDPFRDGAAGRLHRDDRRVFDAGGRQRRYLCAAGGRRGES